MSRTSYSSRRRRRWLRLGDRGWTGRTGSAAPCNRAAEPGTRRCLDHQESRFLAGTMPPGLLGPSPSRLPVSELVRIVDQRTELLLPRRSARCVAGAPRMSFSCAGTRTSELRCKTKASGLSGGREFGQHAARAQGPTDQAGRRVQRGIDSLDDPAPTVPGSAAGYMAALPVRPVPGHDPEPEPNRRRRRDEYESGSSTRLFLAAPTSLYYNTIRSMSKDGAATTSVTFNIATYNVVSSKAALRQRSPVSWRQPRLRDELPAQARRARQPPNATLYMQRRLDEIRLSRRSLYGHPDAPAMFACAKAFTRAPEKARDARGASSKSMTSRLVGDRHRHAPQIDPSAEVLANDLGQH